MSGKILEKLWQQFPESHLHCDATMAGLNTYRVVASLITREGETIASVDHYGSGDLAVLKDQAVERLVAEIQETVKR